MAYKIPDDFVEMLTEFDSTGVIVLQQAEILRALTEISKQLRFVGLGVGRLLDLKIKLEGEANKL